MAIADWTQSIVVKKIAGWEGLFCGCSACYGAFAIVLKDKYERIILPIGFVDKDGNLKKWEK